MSTKNKSILKNPILLGKVNSVKKANNILKSRRFEIGDIVEVLCLYDGTPVYNFGELAVNLEKTIWVKSKVIENEADPDNQFTTYFNKINMEWSWPQPSLEYPNVTKYIRKSIPNHVENRFDDL